MDHKALKLELIERLALIEDDAVLQAIKRLLDAPRGYTPPNEHLSVVREGEETYLPALRDRLHALVESIEDAKWLAHFQDLLVQANNNLPAGVWSDLSEEQKQRILNAHERSLDPATLHASEEVLKRRRP